MLTIVENLSMLTQLGITRLIFQNAVTRHKVKVGLNMQMITVQTRVKLNFGLSLR